MAPHSVIPDIVRIILMRIREGMLGSREEWPELNGDNLIDCLTWRALFQFMDKTRYIGSHLPHSTVRIRGDELQMLKNYSVDPVVENVVLFGSTIGPDTKYCKYYTTITAGVSICRTGEKTCFMPDDVMQRGLEYINSNTRIEFQGSPAINIIL